MAACSTRLSRAQQRGNKYYNYALNSMFDTLLKSLFRAKEVKSHAAAASAAEFLCHLSVGYPDAMAYARGQLLIDCPLLVPDFDAIEARDRDMEKTTAHAVTVEERWKGHRLNLFLTMLHTLQLEDMQARRTPTQAVVAGADSVPKLLFALDYAWMWLAQVINRFSGAEYTAPGGTGRAVPDVVVEAVAFLVEPLEGTAAGAGRSVLDMLATRYKSVGGVRGPKKALAKGIRDSVLHKASAACRNHRAGMVLEETLRSLLQ